MGAYSVDNPSVISFSGGRTSAFMLRQVLDAHGGQLPDGCHVIFCNTGLEHSGTLRFIHEVAINWNVPIVWLEWRSGNQFAQVSYETASRKGEPFSALIRQRSMLPNGRMRFCTQELKIRTTKRYCEDFLGLEDWQELIGLRYDEPRRVANLANWPGSRNVYAPMYHAHHDLAHVRAFWSASPFDLDIPSWAGNCVGCFLKRESTIRSVAEEMPTALDWWHAQESTPITRSDGFQRTARFANDRPTYGEILSSTQDQRQLFDIDDAMPCSCTD